MEPLDQEKKKYLNEVIYPNLNTQLVETTKLRQHLPYRCAQKHSRKCHFECQYLVSQRLFIRQFDWFTIFFFHYLITYLKT